MPSSIEESNIVIDRDYTDNFSIKETAIEKLGAKYFDDLAVKDLLNVGATGFVLEQISNITEDVFNTTSLLIKEAFPNKASIPESIYTHAGIFQLDTSFATPGVCQFMLVLQQDEVLAYGKTVNGRTDFYIDKNTVINIENIPFTLDYDIKISAQKKLLNGTNTVDYNFNAQYIIDNKNSISDINDPYLKIRKVTGGFLLLQFTMRQVSRTVIEDSIINNTKINFPILEFEFEGMLAGFDIFYKAPGDKDYTQLTKKIMFSLPIKQPFCYYRLKDENILKIVFSTREGYFQPEFNSEIKVIMYTTLGKVCEFENYSGNNIEFIMSSETYEYNESLTLVGKTVSDCSGATDKMDLEALQALTVENYSTATELSTENDLQTYFHNYKYRHGSEIYILKRRDDIRERLLSAFLLLKNDGYIYPTNTVNLRLKESEYDSSENKNRFSLKAGHVFVYYVDSRNTVKLVPNVMCYETNKVEELMKDNLFVYTNPFMISVTKRPTSLGFYKTIVNQTSILDYITSNNNSFTQFITSKVNINRGLHEDSKYTMSLSIVPSSSMDEYIHDYEDYTKNDVRVIAGFIGKNGDEAGFIEMNPLPCEEGSDKTNVTFSVDLETNDHVSSDGLFPILNATKLDAKSDYMYIPSSDTIVNIYILYFDGITTINRFTNIYEDCKYYTVTNLYSTKSDKLTFVEPMNMIRSTVIFGRNVDEDGEPIIESSLSLIPMIKADLVNDDNTFNTFVKRLTDQYYHMESCLPVLRNNTNIDIKFYNTYGRSVNYLIGDNKDLIDRVNIKIAFNVWIVSGVDELELKNSLKVFIKDFIEKVNSSGNNDLFISNLIRAIENNFAAVHHLKFLGINDYSVDNQTISIKETNLENLTKTERQEYVPEIIVVDPDDIKLSMITC